MHRLSKLKNGITFITVPVPGTKAVTVMAMFSAGSRYEAKELSGASHFVEHMLFKGTAKRPTHLHISRELDAAGAEYNAFTYKDFTGYYVKIDSAQTELAFDLLSDMIFHSKLDKEEIEKEKGVITEEIRMYEDNPTMAVDLLFDKALFGDHPLGWDIAGTKKSVASLTRESLYKYYQRHYVVKNMVLAVAGNIEENKLKKSLKYFTKESTPPIFKKSLVESYIKFSWPSAGVSLKKRVKILKRKVDQAHIIIGFPGLKNNHPDRFAASVLLNILGGGMSSRLFVEVREKRGLAYMIHTGAMSFRDTGAFSIQAGLDPARLADALKVIKKELGKIKSDLVSAKELADAKSNFAGRMALAMEDSGAQAQWFAKQFLFADKMETPAEAVKKIKKVTVDEVRRVARKSFDLTQMRAAVIGPMGEDIIMKMI